MPAAGVGPSGEIMLPLVNEPVKAEGLTASEVQANVAKALKRYVQDPVVYVGITAYKSKIFYVIDETGLADHFSFILFFVKVFSQCSVGAAYGQ